MGEHLDTPASMLQHTVLRTALTIIITTTHYLLKSQITV